MKAVVWSSTALDQYAQALDYLAQRNETAASRLAARIQETTQALASRPIGRPGCVEGTFEKIVLQTPYLLVFEIAGDELQVLRVFHMSQDWRKWGVELDDA